MAHVEHQLLSWWSTWALGLLPEDTGTSWDEHMEDELGSLGEPQLRIYEAQ